MTSTTGGTPVHKDPAWRAWLSLGACVALLLLFLAVPGDQMNAPPWLSVTLHTLFETASIAVSVLIFSIGWHTFSRERGSRLALVCSLFLAVAILDFIHLLTFEGMPALNEGAGGGKAIPFFLAARLIVAIALLWIALVPWEGAPATTSRSSWLLASLLFAAVVGWFGLSSTALREFFFVPGTGLTAAKVIAEYLIIGMNLVAAAGFLLRARKAPGLPHFALFAAAAIAALSELCFTLYMAPSDETNDLGHIFKVYAYFLLYRALYLHLVSLPYTRLAQARDEILKLNASLEARVAERTQQLALANQELERFSWSVAHDLRSPLSVIRNLSTVLERRSGSGLGPADQKAVRTIGENAVRMQEMIESLLELAHAKRPSLPREAVDLAAIAARTVENLRSAEPRRTVDVQIQSPMTVHGDPRLLANVMENVIGNAWKFSATRAPARIVVGRKATSHGEACFVSDNGIGFDMHDAARLFDPFQRGESDHPVEGHGIGLANVKKIVELHGGTIWAQSSPGQGATFYFTLGPPDG